MKPVVNEDSYYRWIVISIYKQNVKWSLYRNSDVVIILPFLFNEDINLIGDVKFGRRTCQQLNLSLVKRAPIQRDMMNVGCIWYEEHTLQK